MNQFPPRYPALDGLRGMAMLLVFALHIPKPSGLLTRLASLGQTGVDLFFVLSGFLITGILIRAKDTPHALRNFYARRTLRIFPLYYGTLALLYIVLPALGLTAKTPLSEQAWFWLYGQNIGFTFTHLEWPNHFWSLAVEEQFYLLWPLLVMRFDLKHLVRLLIAAIGITLLCRGVMLYLGYGVYYFTLCRLDGLAMGSLVAILGTAPGALSGFVPSAKRWLVGAALPLAVLFAFLSGSHMAVVQVVKGTLLASWFAALIIVLVGDSPRSLWTRAFSVRPLRTVGKYSYALYVFHGLLIPVLVRNLAGWPISLQVLAISAVVFAAAVISWYCWESPFLRRKDRFTAEQPITAKVAA